MRLNKKRILLIEPDEFQALIFSDIDKKFDPYCAEFQPFKSSIIHSLGCDIELDIDYTIKIEINWPADRNDDAQVRVIEFGTHKVTAWYGGDEIEHIILWTDTQYNQFIDELSKYIDQG